MTSATLRERSPLPISVTDRPPMLVALSRVEAPLAQGIEHRPPEPGAQVRILQGAPDDQRIGSSCAWSGVVGSRRGWWRWGAGSGLQACVAAEFLPGGDFCADAVEMVEDGVHGVISEG